MRQNHCDVLVVEDDAAINELVGAYVQLAGYEYRRALDGGSGLRQAQQHPPGLVLLDLMLPDADGFEVCRQLKRDRRTASVPVIILTALNDEHSRRRGLECGAADYLTKPFDPDRLIDLIRRHASANGQSRP
ncbi:MAG TPA: response regulator [Tepidisphaeraceae bacterium]|nr:response regulator [Tepidisphaeraceae bacterium]